MNPPARPMRTVAVRFTGIWPVVSGAPVESGASGALGDRTIARALRSARATIDTAATISAQPSKVLMRDEISSPLPNSLSTNTPAKAAGTDPTTSHLASGQCTVPRRKCTVAPTGFMMSDVRRSLDTAVPGLTPKNSTRIGVMSAPPPMPVRPTVKPTIRPAIAFQTSKSMWLSALSRWRSVRKSVEPSQANPDPIDDDGDDVRRGERGDDREARRQLRHVVAGDQPDPSASDGDRRREHERSIRARREPQSGRAGRRQQAEQQQRTHGLRRLGRGDTDREHEPDADGAHGDSLRPRHGLVEAGEE